MSSPGVVAALVGLVAAAGCGRIGFGFVGGDDEGSDGGPVDGQAACVASSFPMAVTAARSAEPRMAWNGNQVAVAWIEDPAGSPSIHFNTSTLAGPPDAQTTLGIPADADHVALEWDGGNWRLAWSDFRGQDREIIRSVDGQLPQQITSTGKTDMGVRTAAISAGTTAYLWAAEAPAQGYDLVLAVLDAAGTRLVNDVPAVTGTRQPNVHDLVWTGSELVAFHSNDIEIAMVRMTQTGALIAAPVAVVAEPAFIELNASWTGDRFLVTWLRGGGGVRGGGIVYLSPTGAQLTPVRNTPVPSIFASGIEPAIGPSSDIVVWDDAATGKAYLQPVERDGRLGALIELPQTGAISAAWVDPGWALAASQGAMQRDINLVQLCP